jgi:hypothetical protein
VIALLAVGWLTLVAGVAYKSNHAWPKRRSALAGLIQRNPYLRIALTERITRVLLTRANARVVAARRATRRRLIAGLLSVIGAATLVNAPVSVADGSRRLPRHSSGLETIQVV